MSPERRTPMRLERNGFTTSRIGVRRSCQVLGPDARPKLEVEAPPEREIRIPKPEIRKKPEFRIPKARISDGLRSSAFGLRISFGFRASEFGFQVQGFNARKVDSENSLPEGEGRGEGEEPVGLGPCAKQNCSQLLLHLRRNGIKDFNLARSEKVAQRMERHAVSEQCHARDPGR